jgi:hypothetical protein
MQCKHDNVFRQKNIKPSIFPINKSEKEKRKGDKK